MPSINFFAIAITAISLAGPALAAPQTITLEVSNMTCSVCPITVKKALQNVPGVSKVDVSYERKEARVIFDDIRATVAKIEGATFEAGYPSKLKPAKK